MPEERDPHGCLHGEEIIIMQQKQNTAERDAERRHQENIENSKKIAASLDRMTDTLGEFMKATSENTVKVAFLESNHIRLEREITVDRDKLEIKLTDLFTRLRRAEATPGKIAIWVVALVFTIMSTAYLSHQIGKTQGEEIGDHRAMFKKLQEEEAHEPNHRETFRDMSPSQQNKR